MLFQVGQKYENMTNSYEFKFLTLLFALNVKGKYGTIDFRGRFLAHACLEKMNKKGSTYYIYLIIFNYFQLAKN